MRNLVDKFFGWRLQLTPVNGNRPEVVVSNADKDADEKKRENGSRTRVR